MKKNRIGILTGGGDCAGINPAIKWAVKTALDERVQRDTGIQYEVLGIKDGWKGLMQADPRETEQYVMPLNQETVRTWDRYGAFLRKAPKCCANRIPGFGHFRDRPRSLCSSPRIAQSDVMCSRWRERKWTGRRTELDSTRNNVEFQIVACVSAANLIARDNHPFPLAICLHFQHFRQGRPPFLGE
jgi:hypothetical protein